MAEPSLQLQFPLRFYQTRTEGNHINAESEGVGGPFRHGPRQVRKHYLVVENLELCLQ